MGRILTRVTMARGDMLRDMFHCVCDLLHVHFISPPCRHEILLVHVVV